MADELIFIFFVLAASVVGISALVSAQRTQNDNTKLKEQGQAKVRDWLILLGYNVLPVTEDCPRSHMLGAIRLQSRSKRCDCGYAFGMIGLSEVVPANGPGLVRVAKLGHVCPNCGSTAIDGQPEKASVLGRRVEHGTNFFDLLDVMSREEAEKVGSLRSDDVRPVVVPCRTAS